jgi:cytochrome b561
MKPLRYSKLFITLHWSAAILLFSSALIAKQKEFPRLPLNLHTILGSILLIVMVMRLIAKIKMMQHGILHFSEFLFYLLLYLLAFFVLGMGVWIAYQRNLLGYILDPNSAIGRGSFKLLADIHKSGWQILFGWILLHVSALLYRQFLKKEPVLKRMWFK